MAGTGYLAVNAPPQADGGYGASPTPPQTFGEVLRILLARATTFEKICTRRSRSP
jgi:hypothetical protein